MRLQREDYFMKIAEIASERSTCDRAHVGAIAVKDNRVIATGYNGSAKGAKHCDDIGHQIVNDHCIRTIHAEMNVICQCASMGISLEGSTIYCTHIPCFECQKHLVNSGVKKIIYKEEFGANVVNFFPAQLYFTKYRDPSEDTEMDISDYD